MKRALLVIDVQYEYFTGKLPVTHPNGSLENILRVMEIAAEKGISVVVIQHAAPQENALVFKKGSHEWELHSEVSKRHIDCLVEKNLPGSFTNTILEAWLREKEIDTITISGYMTQMCCDTTARQAFHLGFSVEFLADATGTLTIKNNAGEVTAEELHRAILVTQEARFSKVMTTADWIDCIKNF